MFDSISHPIEAGMTRHTLSNEGQMMTYADVLELWTTSDSAFRTFFSSLLANSPFSGLRWETPPITVSTTDRVFEFVLIDTPGFAKRSTDSQTFNDYFTTDDEQQGVVSFKSLRKDSTLIVPSPRTANTAYGHLAAFVRDAPLVQVDAMWQVLANTIAKQLCDVPMWISTAGGGVAWLHVRLDSRPKYYRYAPYRSLPLT